jgi:hypothetical protein
VTYLFEAYCELVEATPSLKRVARQSPVGKKLPDHLYVHRSALSELPKALARMVEAAEAIAGTRSYDVAKIAHDGRTVSLLVYPGFFKEDHPALERAVLVNLETGTIKEQSWRGSKTPPVLHRKETFLSPSHPRHGEFAELTRKDPDLTEAKLWRLLELLEQADSTDTQTRPMQFIKALVGTIITPGMRVLDFGSGRHARNADYLRGKGVKCYAYDPFKATEGDGWGKGSVSENLPGGLFDLVFSTYVLNTVKPDEAATILRQAEKRGKSQIHVVRDDLDKDKASKGYETSRGFQRAVDLSSKGYTAHRKGGSYVAWTKGVKL